MEPGLLWPQFTEAKGESKPENAQYKKEINNEFWPEAVGQSWLKICRELDVLTAEIASKGTSVNPVLKLDEILAASA